MARFFARLVGGIFLGAGIAQDVAQRSSSLSAMAVFRSILASGLMRYSFSMSNFWEKSMYFVSSGSQKWSCVAEMILSKAVVRSP
jgi:hypothetical protein